jgi:hypothetical protein
MLFVPDATPAGHDCLLVREFAALLRGLTYSDVAGWAIWTSPRRRCSSARSTALALSAIARS